MDTFGFGFVMMSINTTKTIKLYRIYKQQHDPQPFTAMDPIKNRLFTLNDVLPFGFLGEVLRVYFIGSSMSESDANFRSRPMIHLIVLEKTKPFPKPLQTGTSSEISYTNPSTTTRVT